MHYVIEHWPAIALVSAVSLIVLAWIYLPTLWGAPWVPSSLATVRRMLHLAGVQAGQKVVDLGAGDGRIVIMAARQFKAQAVGVEMDPIRCLIANTLIRLFRLQDRARIHRGDLFGYDLTDADVVTLYLLRGTNDNLSARLARQLRPGAKVVSLKFPLLDWAPVTVDEQKRIFVYEVGNGGLPRR